MRERNQILELWEKIRRSGESAVLATVVKTQGSSYRLPGARLLLTQAGERVGGISGGCLEDDLIKKAWWLTAQGPVIRKYDTTADGEISADGYGLGCNGIIHVLIERVTAGHPSVLPYLEAATKLRQAATIAHLISSPEMVGERLVLDAAGNVHSSSLDVALVDQLLTAMQGSTDSELLVLPDGHQVFLEKLTPPLHLLVFGAGDDAIPLVELAKYLGWRVSVFDGRAHYARAEKFPSADRVSIRPPNSPVPPIDPWTVAVIMTHSYRQDLDVLRTLAREPLRYLGVLGPRKRALDLLAEANQSENSSLWQQNNNLHSPMGLDLGGHGPELVAVAVISEIQAVLNGRTGGALRDRGAPIHSEDELAESRNWVRSIVCA